LNAAIRIGRTIRQHDLKFGLFRRAPAKLWTGDKSMLHYSGCRTLSPKLRSAPQLTQQDISLRDCSTFSSYLYNGPLNSAVWPISPASSRKRSHHLSCGGAFTRRIANAKLIEHRQNPGAGSPLQVQANSAQHEELYTRFFASPAKLVQL